MFTPIHSKPVFSSLKVCALLVVATIAWSSRAVDMTPVKDLRANFGANYSDSSLIQGSDGAFYGTTYYGGFDDGSNGYGTVFRVTKDGAFTILHEFNDYDGAYPAFGLLQAKDGLLYGTCYSGSGQCANGCIFKINIDGTGFAVVHPFTLISGGASVYCQLIQGTDARLYGTTSGGGISNKGTVFAVKTDGTGFVLLHSFGGSTATPPDGSAPYQGVIQGTDGALYGTTYSGGTGDYGTVFTVKTDGTGYALVHEFTNTDGNGPDWAPLVQDKTSGILYGTTYAGGANSVGTVFAIKTDGSGFLTLHSFKNDGVDGYTPYCGLILAKDGNLYGTTYQGGSVSNYGTVFKIDTVDGSGYQKLYTFTNGANNEGSGPDCGLIQASDGSLYGITEDNGPYRGNIFRLNTDGTGFTVIDVFGQYQPNTLYGTVMLAKDGMLYGTTNSGGTHDDGALYRVKTDGTQFTVIHSFATFATDPTNAGNPYAGVIQDTDGTFYGTTYDGAANNYGCVYKISPDGSGFTILHSFSNVAPDGEYPYKGLLLLVNGTLYGTTEYGGATGYGTVFSLKTDGSGYATLHSFANDNIDGYYPYDGVIIGKDGMLYSTTEAGGPPGYGTVFKMNTDGTGYSIIHAFTSDYDTDGQYPYGKVIQGSDGMLYGTTESGGVIGDGAVFTLATDGSKFKLIHSFNDYDDGEEPYTGLIQANDGTLYGTCYTAPGTYNGTVFKLNTDGSGFQAVFTKYNIYHGLTLGSDGNAYGVLKVGGQDTDGQIFSVKAGSTFSSQPVATPNPAIVGEAVQFTAGATQADGDTLRYGWNFGDGSTGSGQTVSHTYSAPGTFVASVTVSPADAPAGAGGLTSSVSVTVNAGPPAITNSPFTISSADGIPDEMKSAATAAGVNAVTDPRTLPDVKLAIKLNFSKPGNDAIGLSGTLVVGANYNPNNVPFIVDVGGVIKSFTLNATGKVKSGNDSVALGVKKSAVPATTKFSVKLSKGSFASTLAAAGLTNATAKGATVNIPVGVIIGQYLWVANVAESYTATKDKSGSSKNK